MDLSHRKAVKTVTFTDQSGKPLAGRRIRIRQKEHAFLFGCGGFDFIPYVSKGDIEYKRVTDSWLKAPSGYIREDNSPKPSYEMLKGLVKREWWTDTEITTDENGRAGVEAFKGQYSIVSDNLHADTDFVDNSEQTVVLDAV